VVIWVIVYMVDLNWLAALPTNAAGSVMKEKSTRSYFRRDVSSTLVH